MIESHIQKYFVQHFLLLAEFLTCCFHKMPESREILMFVCLQEDAVQCCDATKICCAHCATGP